MGLIRNYYTQSFVKRIQWKKIAKQLQASVSGPVKSS